MPDNLKDAAGNLLLPKQNCSSCFKAYCSLYWVCEKATCKKCLFKFADMKVDNECLKNLINDNQFESELFANWLLKANKQIQDVFDQCSREYGADLAAKVVCRECGHDLFKKLAYKYRSSIPQFNGELKRIKNYLSILFLIVCKPRSNGLAKTNRLSLGKRVPHPKTQSRSCQVDYLFCYL